MAGSDWWSTPACSASWPRGGRWLWSAVPTARRQRHDCWPPPSPPTGGGPVATNATGANMPAGHVAALVGAPVGAPAVLEVDEGYLGRLIEETRPRVVLLLNLSRDQLDRISEVRMMVERWREAAGRLSAPSADGSDGTVVVANADDPWWSGRPVPPPTCAGWGPDRCGARMPPAVRSVAAASISAPTDHGPAIGATSLGPAATPGWRGRIWCSRTGRGVRLDLGLPGQFNRSNGGHGRRGRTVDGRARAVTPARRWTGWLPSTRLPGVSPPPLVRADRCVCCLAKNPAGWTAVFDLLDESGPRRSPLVLSVNARTADGFDTSWLWDVPFERLVGRAVVATGDRRRDLAVRLRYAEVDHEVVADPLAAVDRAVGLGPARTRGPADRADGPLDIIANYTAFADLRGRL